MSSATSLCDCWTSEKFDCNLEAAAGHRKYPSPSITRTKAILFSVYSETASKLSPNMLMKKLLTQVPRPIAGMEYPEFNVNVRPEDMIVMEQLPNKLILQEP